MVKDDDGGGTPEDKTPDRKEVVKVRKIESIRMKIRSKEPDKSVNSDQVE